MHCHSLQCVYSTPLSFSSVTGTPTRPQYAVCFDSCILHILAALILTIHYTLSLVSRRKSSSELPHPKHTHSSLAPYPFQKWFKSLCLVVPPTVSCSAIIGPIARVVFKQERMEGNFRFAHMRLRTFHTELALYRAGAAEGAALEAALAPLLSNQLSLLMWRWLLTACTTGLEYTGALLNYTCIGLVVFTGALQYCPFCHSTPKACDHTCLLLNVYTRCCS